MKNEHYNIVVAANFTADPILPVLEFWQEQLALPGQLSVAPYDQLFQQLLDSHSAMRANRSGLNLLLIDLTDALNKGNTTYDEFVEQFANAVSVATAKNPNARYIVQLCANEAGNSAVETQFQQQLEQVAGLIIIASSELMSTYPCEQIFDPAAKKLGDIPYTNAYFTALGSVAMRRYFHARVAPRKVIVLDCDHTLWSGLCAELGPSGVEITAEHRALQRFAKTQREAGRLLCLASRNIDSDVTAVFEQHHQMQLSLDDITVRKVNWERKSDNLRAMATELGLGLDSFVFIDDDPLQCTEVAQTLPEVLCLQLPETDVESFCDHIWSLDVDRVTAESRQRTQAYQEHASREQLRRKTPSLQEFLASLDLKIVFSELQISGLPRAHELAQRTNQFNISGWRASESELRASIDDPLIDVTTVAVADRFGDYGTVGLMISSAGEHGLHIPLLVLSCRALGRGVEHAMVRHLAQLAAKQGLASLAFEHQHTDRNLPARRFLSTLVNDFDTNSRARLAIAPVDIAQACAPSDSPTANPAPEPKSEARTPQQGSTSELAEIPLQLATIEQIMAKIGLATIPSQGDESPASVLTAAFKQSLGLEELDRNDGFFELGGHSLQAVQILAEVSNHFEIELDPTLLFTTNFSIDELSAEIEHLRDSKGMAMDSVLDQLSALTDG